MIEVTIIETGDWAEVETPADAICAARQMESEASAHLGRHPGMSVRFMVDGVRIFECKVKDLWRYIR